MKKRPTWIFLRGLMRDSRHWGRFPATFKAVVPDAQIELLDFPGNGSLNADPSLTRVEEMVSFCRAELKRRSIEPPYRVLAMSLGAMVTIAWAAEHPDELDACVLINTSLRPFCPPHWRLRPGVWPSLLRLTLLSPTPAVIESQVLALTSRLVRNPAPLLHEWTRWHIDNPVSASNVRRQLQAAAKFRAPATEPDTRLLILCSAADRLVDPRCSKRLAARWGCDIVIHPTAGHDLPLDDGEWVAEAVSQWLRDGI